MSTGKQDGVKYRYTGTTDPQQPPPTVQKHGGGGALTHDHTHTHTQKNRSASHASTWHRRPSRLTDSDATWLQQLAQSCKPSSSSPSSCALLVHSAECSPLLYTASTPVARATSLLRMRHGPVYILLATPATDRVRHLSTFSAPALIGVMRRARMCDRTPCRHVCTCAHTARRAALHTRCAALH